LAKEILEDKVELEELQVVMELHHQDLKLNTKARLHPARNLNLPHQVEMIIKDLTGS